MTPTEVISKSPDWKSLSGKVLEGGYELKEIIEAEREKAKFRVRVLGDYSLKAAASFYILEGNEADDQIGVWGALRTFENKGNLAVPLGAGKLDVEGTETVYVVLQIPDETLEEVVGIRALEPEEAIEVTRSIAKGLQELHANGFVHGCISPGEVLAVGNGIELSTESIRRINTEPIIEQRPAKYLAPESGPRNLTGPSDIWCLGATLFEALTQRAYEPGLSDEAANLKHPFGAMAACCLDPDPDKRCKLVDLDGISRSKTPPVKPKPLGVPPPAVETPPSAVPEPPRSVAPPTSPVPVKPPVVEEVASAGKLRNELPKPQNLPNELPVRRVNSRNEASIGPDDTRGAFFGSKGWIYGIGAFAVVFFALWLLRSGHRSQPTPVSEPTQSTPANTTATATAASGKPGTAWPTKTLDPDSKTTPDSKPTPAPIPERPKVPPIEGRPAGAEGRSIWRLVMFTYNRQQDAEKKAQFINGSHADLHAEVFSPGESKRYLVVAGGHMTREEATRERTKAIREGMPRDSYIQNYNH